MTVTSVEKDLEGLSLTLIADFEAPVEQVWRLWADPRLLEGWWGPPGYPATFELHDLTPGAVVTYFMTGPDGETYHGRWQITSVDPPKLLAFTDRFADENGDLITDMPASYFQMRLIDHKDGTRMEMRSVFESIEDMEKLVEMGAVDGMRLAAGQMDALLAGAAEGEER
jgi:uncharacterized protein YndB with AHSA1/START domain